MKVFPHEKKLIAAIIELCPESWIDITTQRVVQASPCDLLLRKGRPRVEYRFQVVIHDAQSPKMFCQSFKKLAQILPAFRAHLVSIGVLQPELSGKVHVLSAKVQRALPAPSTEAA